MTSMSNLGKAMKIKACIYAARRANVMAMFLKRQGSYSAMADVLVLRDEKIREARKLIKEN